MVALTLKTVQSLFKMLPNQKNWSIGETYKNVAVRYFYKGTDVNGVNIFDKVVEHKNGLKQTGHFTGTKCISVDESSKIGQIETRFFDTGVIETNVESINGFQHSMLSHNGNYRGLAIPPQFSSDVYAEYGDKFFNTRDIKEAIRNPQSLNAKILEMDSIKVH